MSDRMLRDLGLKAGITSSLVLRKAKVFAQVMDVGTNCISVASLKLTGCCKLVICLDLASAELGCPINKTMAVKLSGIPKKAYLNSLKVVGSLLGMEERLSIEELAVQFGCPKVLALAQEALKRYETEHLNESGVEMDFKSTMFQAAALSAVCRKEKIKIDRRKLQDLCAVQTSTFERLIAKLGKNVEDILSVKKRTCKRQQKTLMEEIEEKFQESSAEKQTRIVRAEGESGNYEEWKHRILEQQ